MKTLIVYYSFTGSSAYIAETLKSLLDADIERLIPDSEPPKSGPMKFMIGGKSALARDSVGLAPLSHDVADYEQIILAMPIWAGTFPPAIGEFLRRYNLSGKKVSAIISSAGGKTEKAFRHLAENMAGVELAETLSLTSPLKDTTKTKNELEKFAEKVK